MGDVVVQLLVHRLLIDEFVVVELYFGDPEMVHCSSDGPEEPPGDPVVVLDVETVALLEEVGSAEVQDFEEQESPRGEEIFRGEIEVDAFVPDSSGIASDSEVGVVGGKGRDGGAVELGELLFDCAVLEGVAVFFQSDIELFLLLQGDVLSLLLSLGVLGVLGTVVNGDPFVVKDRALVDVFLFEVPACVEVDNVDLDKGMDHTWVELQVARFQDLEHDVLVLELLAFVGVDLRLRLGVLQVLSE